MCEFCLKHGEGQKWYLEAKNYSEDLLSDLERRKFIRRMFGDPGRLADVPASLERFDRAPALIQRWIRWRTASKMKRLHFGQVVPLEDVERILELTNSIVRVACICRKVSTGADHRYCYGISMAPEGGDLLGIISEVAPGFVHGPDSKGLETLTKEEALRAFEEHERDGLCHTVWTFGTPFIGGLCNCDRPDCLAMQTTVGHQITTMFRAEYVAEIDPDACTGCRACMEACQFGAIGFSAGRNKAQIDLRQCYGCGVCRAHCESDVIRLAPRESVPSVASLW
jgi:ferredoxin